MPYIIHPRRARVIVPAFITAILLASVLPAAASAWSWPTPGDTAACKAHPISQVFASLGDLAEYSLLEGGTFESGAPGWSLEDAAVVEDNVSILGASHSLAIEPDGVAESPSFCVSTEYPSFRFLVRQTSGSSGALNVSLRWTERFGWRHEALVASLQTGPSWVLTPALKLASVLPLWEAKDTLNVQLVFRPTGGAWAIDDVFIDPYRR